MPPKRKGRARGSGRPSGSGRGSGRGRGRGAGSAGRPKKSDTDAQEEGLSKPSKIVTLKIAFNPAAREECAPGLQAVSRPARPVLPDLGGQKVPLKPPGPSGPPAKAATKPPSSSAARPKLIIKLKAPARPINSTPQPILQMAPGPNEVLEGHLRSTIHTLFSIQSNTHGYLGPETQRALVQNFRSLSSNLQDVSRAAKDVNKALPPEVLEYIDDGRNPEIYTREFVELVQKGNKYLKGKSQAVADFRDTLAKDMVNEWPEMKEAVERVLAGKGSGLDNLQGMNGTVASQSSSAAGSQGTV
ncbi:MAG: hypothetical protein LQ340_003461 [Diploschistes diacapsis]|nr:MAG: hypothetical protein LQ340_003461 [Diploschistes diacapsis]